MEAALEKELLGSSCKLAFLSNENNQQMSFLFLIYKQPACRSTAAVAADKVQLG